MKIAIRYLGASAASLLVLLGVVETIHAQSMQRVVIFPLETANVEPSLTAAVETSLRRNLEDAGYSIVDHREALGGEQDATTPSADDANTDSASTESSAERPLISTDRKIEIASQLGCASFFEASLTRFGKAYVLTLTHRETGGAVIQSQQTEARSDEALARAVPQLVAAMHTQKPAKPVDEPSATAASAASAAPRSATVQQAVPKSTGVKVGFLASQIVGSGELGNSTSFGLDIRSETGRVMGGATVALGADFRAPEQLLHFTIHAQIGYYLAQGPIAPYVGGGIGMFFGPRFLSGEDSDFWDSDGGRAGWDFFPTFGLEFLHQTRMRMHMDFRYLFSASASWDHFGHGPGFAVGVNF